MLIPNVNCSKATSASHSSKVLCDGWEFAQVPPISPDHEDNSLEWHPCTVPTSVHVDLMNKGKLENPYKDLNEWDAQWVGEAEWIFRCDLEIHSSDFEYRHIDLVFEGLDTYCDVTLNGQQLLATDNMFLSHRAPCKSYLKSGKNQLSLRFKSPWQEAKKEEREQGGPRGLWNGDSCRLYSRKAQYGWGWDWGPKLLTIGPWRPISLELYNFRLQEVRVDSDLIAPDLRTASMQVTVKVDPPIKNIEMELRFVLRDDGGKTIAVEQQPQGDSSLEWIFNAGKINAWWPIGYGKQPLYSLEVQLLDKNGITKDSVVTRVAFRLVEVIQTKLKDQEGTSFFFKVNGVPIFCAGSNWIPADNFPTNIEPSRYRRWIETLVNGNQNMLRIWGGGMYEHEALYNACDELGVLVWQDFMFACGIYPSYPAFNESIEKEAAQAVRRLRNHPSVVIFAGNNEDYQVAESLDVVDYSDTSGDYMNTEFPGRHIYEIILPRAVSQLSNIHYRRGSPYGGKNSRDPTVGDIHQWNVWHGTQESWHNWDKLSGRFISEFGMQAYPSLRTVNEWSDDPRDLSPQSRVSAQHNKAAGFEKRLETYLIENFRHSFSIEGYIYITQLMQAECLSTAYRLWRRNWKGPGREYTGGALVWQLNDCWPCTSWSIVDYTLRPKPAYFAIKRELSTFTVGIKRKDVQKFRDDTTDAFYEIQQEIEVWGCNSALKSKDVRILLETYHLEKGRLGISVLPATLAPNSSTEVYSGIVAHQPARTSLSDPIEALVIQARMLDPDGQVLSRCCSWPEPYKFLRLPDPGLVCEVEGDKVRLNCQRPVKGLVLDLVKDEETENNGPAVEWSDQAIDLVPGDEQTISAKGLNGRNVTLKHLADAQAY